MRQKIFGMVILVVSLSLVCPVMAKHLFTLQEVVNPYIIEVDGDELFVLDDAVVHVYSLKERRLLRKFGKRGEGPGELLPESDLPIHMRVSHEEDYVQLTSFNKFISYKKSGELVEEKRIAIIASQIIPIDDHFIINKFGRDRVTGNSTFRIGLYTRNFKEIKEIYQAEIPNNYRKKKIAFPLISIYLEYSGETIYVVNPQEGFKIFRFDKKGNPLKPLTKDYKPIKTTKAYKKEKMEELLLAPIFKRTPEAVKKMFYFSDYLPIIRNFLVRDGLVYVQTHKPNDPLSEFFILDSSGKCLKTLNLPGATAENLRVTPSSNYDFQGNTYYYLAEDSVEELWELHTYTW